MQAVIDQLTKPEAMKVVAQGEKLFSSLPHLPKGVVSFLVGITPWLAGLGGILSVLGALSSLSGGLGVARYSAWMSLAGLSTSYFLVSGVFQAIAAGLLLMSFSYLQKRALTGWLLLFWEMVVSTIMVVVLSVLSGGFGLGSLVGVIIGFYILFEIKSAYKA